MDKIADLKKLKTLFEEGFLTKYEFDYLKDELLGNKPKTTQEIPQLKNKDVIDNDKKVDVLVSNHQPKTKIVYEAKQIACAQCKKQITLSQSKDNKGLCNQCVKSKKSNKKWYLLLILLIPIGWIGYNYSDQILTAINSPQENNGNISSDAKSIDYSNERHADLITKYLSAEDTRDFKVIQPFFSKDLKRYYNLENPNFKELENQYVDLKDVVHNQKTTVNSIRKINDSSYIVKINVSFFNLKTNNNSNRETQVRIEFDKADKITKVFTDDVKLNQ